MADDRPYVIVAANMKALLIDHDDSFTQNLKHWLKPIFQEISVINHLQLLEVQNFETIEQQFDLVILSPGPKTAKDYPHTLQMLKSLKSETAVYGVCLGLQMMATSCNCPTSVYFPPRHGKVSKLKIKIQKFKSFENLKIARYHSIKVDRSTEKDFEIIAVSGDDNIPMWLQHKRKKWIGVQFHPESFMTESANLHLQALKNWMGS